MAEADWKVTQAHRAGDDSRSGDLTSSSESELVAACARGTTEAFDILVARHQRQIYQLCYRFVGNHEDASDLSQETFLRAYRGVRSFRGQSSVGTWLYRIAVNVCLTRAAVRRPSTEPLDARQHVDTRSESPADKILRGEQADRVRAAIGGLPPKQRAALILRVYQELSHNEIADLMGSSVGTVKANVFHALQNLKRILGREVS
jgi:RNA polymerase sigma-70 factor (ECF subfamily)